MAEGLLEVEGEIDLAQFWPAGSSDADTSKIRVDVAQSSFRFRPHTSARFRTTRVFNDATVKGKTTKPAIDASGRITVRLQGIDAPELHYRPSATLKKAARTAQQNELYLKWNLEYRQPLAESSTVALTRKLAQAGASLVSCVVRSFVDAPNDVFDTYGRFVGDIFVRVGTREISINLWAVKSGWALPAFYNSMSDSEIATLIDAANSAYDKELGVWPELQERVGTLDFKREFRRKGAALADDTGPVLVPKLFRRLAEHAVNKKAKMLTGSFHEFLEGKKDACFATDDFLDQGVAAEQRQLHEFVARSGSILYWPEDLVFKDAPSNLVIPGGGAVEW